MQASYHFSHPLYRQSRGSIKSDEAPAESSDEAADTSNNDSTVNLNSNELDEDLSSKDGTSESQSAVVRALRLLRLFSVLQLTHPCQMSFRTSTITERIRRQMFSRASLVSREQHLK